MKYDCKITTHRTIFQLQYVMLLNNHQYNCNITKSFLSADDQIKIRNEHLYEKYGVQEWTQTEN